MTPSKRFLLQAQREWRWLLAVVLILSATLGLHALSHGSPVVLRKNLDEFPHQVGVWNGVDVAIEERVLEVLGASDFLNRVYLDPQSQTSIGMFVGFFASQRKGGSIHSPKNCLPGAGWSVVKGDTIPLTVSGYAKPLEVNRYTIQKDQNQQVVLYWYQSQGRVVASEYSAKIYLVWDAITKNRTDGALVRIVSPVQDGDAEAALEKAKAFVRETYPRLTEYIPS